jgi:hypothetical protein
VYTFFSYIGLKKILPGKTHTKDGKCNGNQISNYQNGNSFLVFDKKANSTQKGSKFEKGFFS